MPPQNPTTEPRPDAGGYYRQVSQEDPLANPTAPKPPGSPSQYEFMLKDQPKPRRSFGLPSSKVGKILILSVGVLILVFAAALLFGGGKSPSSQVINLMAQTQEVIRVTQVENQKFSDTNVLNLSATTKIIMSSQQSDLATYLKKIKVKANAKQLATHLNKNTDTQLATAKQNNSLDSAYVAYIKTALTSYQSSMQTVEDLRKSGWQEVKTPKTGDVLVWEPKKFPEGMVGHIGFYIGGGQAISTSIKTKTPIAHEQNFGDQHRKITHIFRMESWDDA